MQGELRGGARAIYAASTRVLFASSKQFVTGANFRIPIPNRDINAALRRPSLKAPGKPRRNVTTQTGVGREMKAYLKAEPCC
ncbi:MAG: hypothetical protein QOJ40_1042 [Verrucomicrobiota bacterium]